MKAGGSSIMRRIAVLTICALPICALPLTAVADQWDKVDHRVHELHEQIQAGQRAGQLEPWQSRRLQEQLWNVKMSEQAFAAKGWLDGNEYWALMHMLDVVNQNLVYSEQHRGDAPPGGGNGWWDHGDHGGPGHWQDHGAAEHPGHGGGWRSWVIFWHHDEGN